MIHADYESLIEDERKKIEQALSVGKTPKRLDYLSLHFPNVAIKMLAHERVGAKICLQEEIIKSGFNPESPMAGIMRRSMAKTAKSLAQLAVSQMFATHRRQVMEMRPGCAHVKSLV